MDKRMCSVDGCTRISKARSFCYQHYWRLKNLGDPQPEQPIRSRARSPWEHIQRSEGCWLWTGPIDKDGYGRATRRLFRAHRWMHEQVHGPIPAGFTVDHLCHNQDVTCQGGPSCRHRRCVNPEHLGLATPTENRERARSSRAFCRHGHLYDLANTYVDPKGKRSCRECRRLDDARRRALLAAVS